MNGLKNLTNLVIGKLRKLVLILTCRTSLCVCYYRTANEV